VYEYISVYFVFEGQITQQSTVLIGKVAADRNVSLLCHDEVDNNCYNA
jgi:hypothetical protein